MARRTDDVVTTPRFLRCPACGYLAEGVRCPRCNALKISDCSGACLACRSKCPAAPGR